MRRSVFVTAVLGPRLIDWNRNRRSLSFHEIGDEIQIQNPDQATCVGEAPISASRREDKQ